MPFHAKDEGDDSSLVPLEERLKIPDRFTLIPVGDGEFRLHSLSFSLALSARSGDLIARLLPLLDGAKTIGEILRELDSYGTDKVRDSIEYLLKAGALERAGTEDCAPLSTGEVRRFRPQIAFFSHFVARPGAAPARSQVGVPQSGLEYQQRIKRAHVAVFGVGRLGSQLIRSLALAGVGKITAVDSQPVEEEDLNCDSWFRPEQRGLNRAQAAGELSAAANSDVAFHAVQAPEGPAGVSGLLTGCDFAVLCPDQFNPAEYEEFNLAAMESKTSWTSARLAGFEFLIGPTIIPGETPCFQCFTLRLKSNLPDYAEYVLVEEYLKKGRLQAETLAITPGAGLLALEVLKAITWFMAPATYAHLFSLNLLTLQSKSHPILKIPRCPACGRTGTTRPTIHAWQQSKVDLMP